MDTPHEPEKLEQRATRATAAELAAVQAAAKRVEETQLAAAHAAGALAAAARAAEVQLGVAIEPAPAKAQEPKTEPKLRHEFVGMMFALAIGEVAVQTATLVRADHWAHFLPAYSHLFLATFVIATSWVGWTLSLSPGARQDVRSVLEWEFLVLLIDVFLVVVYFILAKTVDITGETSVQLKASARPESIWILVIFAVYVIWDCITKIAVYLKEKERKPWFRFYGSRMIPTIVCFVLSCVALELFKNADAPHVLTADIALLSLVLLFRAGKALVESFSKPGVPRKWPIVWTAVFLVGFGVFTKWTCSWPMFESIATQIQMVPVEPRNQAEPAAASTRDSRPDSSDR